jgi:hypothetical protein
MTLRSLRALHEKRKGVAHSILTFIVHDGQNLFNYLGTLLSHSKSILTCKI